jgi:uncharacterized OB-fold protein
MIHVPKEKLLVFKQEANLPYRYSAGRFGSRFLMALKEKKILGSRCAKCQRVLVPPRVVCGYDCHGEMEGFVEVGPEGKLFSFSVVCFPFIDPITGVNRPVPYGYGDVELDGASNRFPYFLKESDPTKLRIGLRVRAIFREDPQGEMADILYFETV